MLINIIYHNNYVLVSHTISDVNNYFHNLSCLQSYIFQIIPSFNLLYVFPVFLSTDYSHIQKFKQKHYVQCK